VPVFPGKEWLEAYAERINRSRTYAESAATWEADVTFVVEAEPSLGIPDTIYSWLDLWHGKCRAARYDVPPGEGENAQFLIRCPYSRWKQVIRRELDPIRAMMQGKLKLTADMRMVVAHVKAADTLVKIAGEVPTTVLDEP